LPFFAIGYSPSSNYGGIGAIMGHELTHGFDDQGRAFDENGALRDWWTPAVADAFRDRAQCLVDQFSSYHVAAGVNVDGQLTLGENTADLGGLLLAYDAMHHAALKREPERSRLDGDQQFFLAYAQLYCENTSADVARQDALSDPHSPGQFRVNGTLANVPAFAEAFECKGRAPSAGAAGHSDICQIW
jgi:predicted metalloendopeptidase